MDLQLKQMVFSLPSPHLTKKSAKMAFSALPIHRNAEGEGIEVPDIL